MTETEITVQVFNSLAETQNILNDNGFKLIETKKLCDYYFSKYSMDELEKQEYSELINNSILARKVSLQDKDINLIIYKIKNLDKLGNVISEEKVDTKVENFENTLRIFELAHLTHWCKLEQDLYIYNKDNIQFCLQVIDDLGIFIEYEEDDSMSHLTSEQMKIEYMLGILKSLRLKIGNDYSCKKVLMKFKQKKYTLKS